ncbi:MULTISPECIES: phosphotransferase enzyme family protein [Pedobacter]|uniref:Aminoglycoside phosphotransferase n=1 Tax=Pedobacter heparinus (strain ATCC 13125 / DSM 2366 / CIP 104194 / JCM 7457 / NBRC 12017 / NCIMB 9290 / NRRL B-14731 / HIM 762-3) TaxID=485917 RepID=C6XYJ1_PEDHD|nr:MULTISPECIES: aminoglycoside phosphotransferase family protein [Pedobacter]ACU04473.1 aminoglycoside phosphotransferase [Pedobacter heparinus DSM 2366]MBB5437671.1 Ser/Thr protein kinase RdoA (MazF antagonist) [Pedobacter sp. AK017]
MFENILSHYGLDLNTTNIQPFGDGLINHTWMVVTNNKRYILQKVNSEVFKKPSDIDENLLLLKKYLHKTHPEYLFVSPCSTKDGASLISNEAGYFRLFPFIEGSTSLNTLSRKDEAFQAAKQFGMFSKLLANFDAKQLNITIPNFHNLILRYDQFTEACRLAPNPERLQKAADEIHFINANEEIVHTYRKILQNKAIPLRVIHHDTKISNVLFDAHNKGICVIDLDTVMPGYFISDVGDMMRTYLSEAGEEETDFSKISIRKDFFSAIYEGYMSEMKEVLTDEEKEYFTYSGKFIIYMQAIRFLADYLQNDIYYGAKYEDHNFNRAKNQIVLLKEYIKVEKELIIDTLKVDF